MKFAPLIHVVVILHCFLCHPVFESLHGGCLISLLLFCSPTLICVFVFEILDDLRFPREVWPLPCKLARARYHGLAAKVLLETSLGSAIVDVVLFRVLEGLVGFELLFNHSLDHAIVRELLLELLQLAAQLPFVFWFHVVGPI